MPPSHRIVLSLLLSYFVAASAAVSLADFAPRITGPLPSRCNTVYNQQIDNCEPDDFDISKQRCSAACVSGLVKIMQAVNGACSLDDVSETSIIGVFLLGSGIPILCRGVSVTTIGRSSTARTSSTPAPATISRQPAVRQSSSPTQLSSSAASSTTAEESSAVTPPPAPPTSAVPDPPLGWTLPSSTAPAAARPTPNLQKSNSDSGGGSPFDVVASSASQPQRHATVFMGAVLGFAVLACTII